MIVAQIMVMIPNLFQQCQYWFNQPDMISTKIIWQVFHRPGSLILGKITIIPRAELRANTGGFPYNDPHWFAQIDDDFQFTPWKGECQWGAWAQMKGRSRNIRPLKNLPPGF